MAFFVISPGIVVVAMLERIDVIAIVGIAADAAPMDGVADGFVGWGDDVFHEGMRAIVDRGIVAAGGFPPVVGHIVSVIVTIGMLVPGVVAAVIAAGNH